MTISDRRPGFWRRLLGRADDPGRAAAPAPPLFPLRPVPPPPKGPGLPDWHEILSAAPPVPEPARSASPRPRPTLVPDAAPGVARAAPARRPPTEEERRVLAEVGARLGSGKIAEAAALLDAVFRTRPEACDGHGRPIYLLESLHCALLLGEAEAAAERARRLRPHLAPDDPVIEMLYARTAVAAGDRTAARANWRAALARAPDLAPAREWLAANPLSPDGGISALDLLGPVGHALARRIQPPPSLGPAPEAPPVLPDWLPGRLLSDAAVSVAADGAAEATAGTEAPAARPVPGATGQELALLFRHPAGFGEPHAFAEVLLAAFVLQRQFAGHLRPARLYVGRQAWASPRPPSPPGTAAAPPPAQAEMLAVLFPDLRVIGDHDGALREAHVLVVDAALRNAATDTVIGAMMPQVGQWTAEARSRVHTAFGLPGTAEPPRVPGRRPRVLHLHAAPPRALADPVRERLFALFTAAGFEVALADMAALPWHRQVRLAFGADVVTGAHGPAFNVVLWAHPQTRVVEFFPEGTRRYDGQLLAEAAGLAYLGLEGLAEHGFMLQARERWGTPKGKGNRLIWALPWALLEKALTPPRPPGG
jgi:hypothetical protein